MDGQAILNDPFRNRGTAFTVEERKEYGLTGMLPIHVQTLEEQAAQTYAQFLSKDSDIEKRNFLMTVFNTNRVLFYRLMSEHLVEFMPIVYDPVIAQDIEHYHELFIQPQGTAYLDINHPENIRASLENAADGRHIRLIVATDAEGILGIGDWGTNGSEISVGKLMIYTAAAGIDPAEVLPVSLDVGTNNERLRENPLYLGNRHARIYGEQYDDFIEKFVEAAEDLFPGLYLHWEDFGRSNATRILKKYQDRITTFNDDVQGTGIVSMAGILGGLNISGEKLVDQCVLTFGAGTAGVGIANLIMDEMVRSGLSEEEARKHFYLVDKQGLLFEDTEGLTEEQKPFARQRSEFEDADSLTGLLAIVRAVHPTVMIGTSTQAGAFTEQVVREMASHTERPIIFPLSNPTELAEAKAEDLIRWTEGRALVGTGIPAADVEYNGVTYQIGQANNALMYPGLGLGVLVSDAKILNGETISRASHALGGIVDASKPGAAVLPPVSDLTEFSDTIAHAVVESVLEQKLNRKDITDIDAAIVSEKWTPEYKQQLRMK